jgi:hypothetical protein
MDRLERILSGMTMFVRRMSDWIRNDPDWNQFRESTRFKQSARKVRAITLTSSGESTAGHWYAGPSMFSGDLR